MKGIGLVVLCCLVSGGCSDEPDNIGSATSQTELWAGAASVSLLPTVAGSHDYLMKLDHITEPVDPFSPGVYVVEFDQGQIDIDNGRADAAWVHDDIRSTVLALRQGATRLVLVAADVYMIPANDAAAIVELARTKLPSAWVGAEILIATTHNHHGPGTLFSVNHDWYELMAGNVATAIVEAVDKVQPARIALAQGDFRFGINDVRDPVIIDPTVHVMHVRAQASNQTIATVVQWNSHVESTLGWAPPVDLDGICTEQDWSDEQCSAEGRYITADYPGELRGALVAALGGEVLYFVGAIGSQIGPGAAPVWSVTDETGVGDGWTIPAGARPIRGADDYLDKNFVKAEVVGNQLARFVIELVADSNDVLSPALAWRSESFYARLYQVGFKVAMAAGQLGWKARELFHCTGEPNDVSCRSDEGAVIEDPVAGSIRSGDFIRSEVGYLTIDENSGIVFMPGEFPPELLIGLPRGFDDNPSNWYRGPVGQNARGADYRIPGYITSLIDDDFVMGIGLGNDELGYWVPLSDVRLPCVADRLAEAGSCAALHASGLIEWPDEVSGTRCKRLIESAALPQDPMEELVLASCRYGAMFGQLYGHSEGHYEETNSAGIDLVMPSWRAYLRLFGKEQGLRINPDLVGYTPEHPPPN